VEDLWFYRIEYGHLFTGSGFYMGWKM